MAAQILEGTLAEVQQQISTLRLKPERRVRLVVEDNLEVPDKQDCTVEEVKRVKNGVRLFPRSDANQILTPERIAELLDKADYEDAYPTP